MAESKTRTSKKGKETLSSSSDMKSQKVTVSTPVAAAAAVATTMSEETPKKKATVRRGRRGKGGSSGTTTTSPPHKDSLSALNYAPSASPQAGNGLKGPSTDPLSWSIVSETGGSLVQRPSAYSADSASLYVPCGDKIQVYSVATGALLHTLPGKGWGKVVRILPRGPDSLVALYSTGRIVLWNVMDSTCRRGRLGKTFVMYDIAWRDGSSASSSSDTLIAIGYSPTGKQREAELAYADAAKKYLGKTCEEKENEDENSQTYPGHGTEPRWMQDQVKPTAVFSIELSIPPKKATHVSLVVKKLKKFGPEFGKYVDVTVASMGRAVVVADENQLFVAQPGEDGEWDYRCFPVPRKITCVSSHPNNPVVAVGDSTGQIALYYCLNIGPKETPRHTVFHWHAHAVNSMSFTPEGNYIVSGGEEGVLVVWQLQTGTKQFLPRLGAEVLHLSISSCSELYALSLKDNSVVVVTSNMKIKQSVVGVKSAMVQKDLYPKSIGVHYEPRTSNIIMNGFSSSLQIYNPRSSRSVCEIEASPRNRVTRLEDNPILRPNVTKIAFSPSGDWMITVDELQSPFDPSATNSSLKFWYWNAQTQMYVLITRADRPHGSFIINDVAFGVIPSSLKGETPALIAITVAGSKFYIWQCQGNGNYWTMRSASSYKNYSCALSCALSKDGSLLAVAYDHLVTIWDPESNELLSTLVYPNREERLSSLYFMEGTPLLLAVSAKAIYVWNMLSRSVEWSLPCEATSVVVDPSSSRFAITKARPTSKGVSTRIQVMDVHSPVAIMQHKFEKAVKGICFLPVATGGPADLCVMTESSNLLILSQRAQQAHVHAKDLLQVQSRRSAMFTDLFPVEAVNRDPTSQKVAVMPVLSTKGMEVLDAPAHMLPAPSVIFPTFMETFLRRRENQVVTSDVAQMDVDGPADTNEADAIKHIDRIGEICVDFMKLYFQNRQRAVEPVPGR